MPELCKVCGHFEAPVERGVRLCEGCTRMLLFELEHEGRGTARVIDGRHYSDACQICGEYRNRRIVTHPEWGKVCEVDVREAAEVHGLTHL
ncbi:MAG: hypothetical protein AB1486_30530 [Planctomycetota bacterium]